MYEAVVSPLIAWETFYVIIGTAAASLTGVMFVVITLIAGRREHISPEGIAGFTTPSVVHFCIALAVPAILIAPWPTLGTAGLLLGVCGLGGIVYIVIVARRMRRWIAYQPVLEDWLWHVAFPLVSYVTFVSAALLLAGHPTPTLFSIGAAALLLLFSGIHNAWDLVTSMLIDSTSTKDGKQG